MYFAKPAVVDPPAAKSTLAKLFALSRSLRFRLMLWNGAAVLLAGVATLVAVREGVRATLLSEIDALLVDDLREIALAIAESGFPASGEMYEDIDRKARGHAPHGWHLRLLDAEGRQIWASVNAPPRREPPGGWVEGQPITLDNQRVAQYHDRDPRRPGRPTITVRIGVSLDFVTRDMARVDRWVLFAGGWVLLASPGCGWLLAHRAVRPLANIMRTAERLHPENLRERLPTRGVGDELDQLSRTINGLLDRVGLFLRQRQDHLANAAHELRTPLAAMRGAIEVAQGGARSPEDHAELLADLLEECGALETLVNQLLLLAESEADRLKAHREALSLRDLVRRAVDMFAGAAEVREISLECEPGPEVRVEGNRQHLRQVLNNLLDNALKYTPAGGQVRVRLTRDEARSRAVLTVRDTGPGISAEDAPHVFERFYRGDKGRRREGDARGTGLGLSICQAVTHAHDGEISLTSQPGAGVTVTVELPLAPRGQARS